LAAKAFRNLHNYDKRSRLFILNPGIPHPSKIGFLFGQHLSFKRYKPYVEALMTRLNGLILRVFRLGMDAAMYFIKAFRFWTAFSS